MRKLFTSLILGAGLLGGGSPAWAQTEPQAQPQPEAPAKPTAKPRDEIVHVYVKGASVLRPDLSRLPPVDWDELESWIDDELATQAKTRGGKP